MATCVGVDFNDELTCALCLDSWRNPIECVPCGHIFCRDCLPKSAKTCPLCRGQIVSVKAPHRTLINLCERVQVECQGCHWTGTREQSYAHACPEKRKKSTVAAASPPLTPTVAQQPLTSSSGTGATNMVSQYNYMEQYQLGIDNDEYGLMDMVSAMGAQPPPQYGAPDTTTFAPWRKYGLTQQEYEEYISLFNAFDEDGTGSLNVSEVAKLCRVLNYAHTPAEIARLFVEMDTNNNDRISQAEMVEWLSQHKPDCETIYGLSVSDYRDAAQKFREYDQDGDGWLNATDFASLCRVTRVASSDAEAMRIFKDLDKRGSGLVNLHGYLGALCFREL